MADSASSGPGRLSEIEVANLRPGTKVRIRGADALVYEARVVFVGRSDVWVEMLDDRQNMDWTTYLGLDVVTRRPTYHDYRGRGFTKGAFRQCAELVRKFAK